MRRQSSTKTRMYEKNILGSGPFKFAGYEAGQAIKGVRNPDYYRPGLPYLDGFTGVYADKQAVRVDALRADRAAIEFRGLPPSVRDELRQSLGDQITVQESDWNCSNLITPNHTRKPFDDVRVRRALTLALNRCTERPVYPRSRSCVRSAERSSPARHSPQVRRSWSSSLASGRMSKNREPKHAAC